MILRSINSEPAILEENDRARRIAIVGFALL
jgi:hypothetical protein